MDALTFITVSAAAYSVAWLVSEMLSLPWEHPRSDS